jgi:hypothetical protein
MIDTFLGSLPWIFPTIFQDRPRDVVKSIRVLLDVHPILSSPCRNPFPRVACQLRSNILVEIEPLRFHPRRINGRKFDANVPLSILHNLAHFVLCMPFQNDFQSLQPRCLQGSVQSHTIRGVSRRIEGERRSSYSLQASQRQAAWFRQAHPRITWDDRFDAADISVGLRCSILNVLISMFVSLRNLPR